MGLFEILAWFLLIILVTNFIHLCRGPRACPWKNAKNQLIAMARSHPRNLGISAAKPKAKTGVFMGPRVYPWESIVRYQRAGRKPEHGQGHAGGIRWLEKRIFSPRKNP